MALIWAESFDVYGASEPLVHQAGYNSITFDGPTTNLAFVRTGTGAGFFSGFGAGLNRACALSDTIGQGCGWMPTVVGGGTVNDCCFRLWDNGPALQCSVGVMPDLSVAVFDSTNTKVGQSAINLFTLNNYSWIEVRVDRNVGGVVNTGKVEVRVQGVTVLIVNGINLPNQFAYFGISKQGGGGGTTQTYIDDWIVWDTTTAQNNDFMGDRRLWVSYPNANDALQDFVPTAAPAWDCLNNSPPIDTTYIEGAASGNISEFGKSAIGINSNDVAAIVVWGRLAKSDAGAASAKLGLTSGAVTLNSADINPGTTFAFSQVSFPLDPNGNVPWTRASADAAQARITRSA